MDTVLKTDNSHGDHVPTYHGAAPSVQISVVPVGALRFQFLLQERTYGTNLNDLGVVQPEQGAPIDPCGTYESKTYWGCGKDGCDTDKRFELDEIVPTIRPTDLSSACASAATSFPEASKSAGLGEDCVASFSGGQMAGVGLGIGLPLLIAFLTVLWLLLSEKKKRKGTAEREGQLNPRYAARGFESAYYKPIVWNTGNPRDSETIELCGNPSEIRNRNTDSPP